MPRRTRVLVAAALAGGGLGLVVALAVGLVLFHRLPLLDRAAYTAALARWEANGPASYDIEVEVEGPQAAHYRVEVRRGEVQAASIDGRPLKDERTLGTWSVPGMFGTLDRDLGMQDEAARRPADPNLPRLVLRAQFDPELGYPARYERMQLGTQMDVTWQVTLWERRQDE